MNVRHHRRLTVWLAAASTAFGLLVAAPAAQAVSVDPPSLKVWPHCAPEGVAVDVAAQANDLPADVVTFFLGDTQVGDETEVDDGEADATLHIPALAAGNYTIEVRPNGEGPTDPYATASFQVPCVAVSATPNPVAFRSGPLTLQLTADGYDYPPNYDYETFPVVFALDGQNIATADQDKAGHVSKTVTLTAVPDCGSHQVTADFEQPRKPYNDFEPTVTASQTTLVVTCPTLTPDPPTVAQSALPTGVQVSGNGWDPGAGVTLSIDGASVATATANKSGQFTTTVPLGVRPCGTVAIIGVELPPAGAGATLPQPTATTTVEVTCTTVTTTDPTDPTQPAPTLTASPIVSSGGVSLASGHGFTPGSTVRLTWVLPDGSTAPGGLETVVAADGSITASCLVLTHARLGPRTLRAEQGSLAASAPVLVVNGPMEPGRDRLLGRR
jgi:hypothetical protein